MVKAVINNHKRNTETHQKQGVSGSNTRVIQYLHHKWLLDSAWARPSRKVFNTPVKKTHQTRQILLLLNCEKIQTMLVDHFQYTATTTGHTGKGVLGNDYRQAGFFHN